MALPQVPVITPDNLKIILPQILEDYTSKLNTKVKVSMVETKNSVSLTADTTTVTIGIANYNKDSDILHVFKDNVLVETGYTISTDSLSVTFDAAITATTELPVVIKFDVIKASLSAI